MRGHGIARTRSRGKRLPVLQEGLLQFLEQQCPRSRCIFWLDLNPRPTMHIQTKSLLEKPGVAFSAREEKHPVCLNYAQPRTS